MSTHADDQPTIFDALADSAEDAALADQRPARVHARRENDRIHARDAILDGADGQLIHKVDGGTREVIRTHADLTRARKDLRGRLLEHLGIAADRKGVNVPANTFVLDMWAPFAEPGENDPAGRWLPYTADYSEAIDAVKMHADRVWRLRCDPRRLRPTPKTQAKLDAERQA